MDPEPPIEGKGLSGAERGRRFRLKNREKYNEYNKTRMKKKRQQMKVERQASKSKSNEYKKKERERKRSYRQKKRNQAANIAVEKVTSSSYKTPQSLGKAVKRAAAALPTSQNKKRIVIKKLASCSGINIPLTPVKTTATSRKQNIEQLVVDFFNRPDIVYTCPGLKDEVTVWQDGKKLKMRKLYLTMFMKEAHSLFLESHPSTQMGFSTFCKHRPDNVKLLHETPSDQCKCLTCENFFLKLSALNLKYETSSFWPRYLCDSSENSQCWQGVCMDCSNGQKFTVQDDQLATSVTWKEWAKDSNKRLVCSIRQNCVGELVEKFQAQFPVVTKHINVKRIQANAFRADKENPNIRALQIDFAMNYSCEYQTEVQSVLWSRGSVTLFTAATIHKGECKTYLVCSDTKEKEKNTVAAFLRYLYESKLAPTSKEMASVEEVIWSDGPSSEFKNKFMVHLLQQLSNKYSKKFSWKYTATSHGKGVVDGIGGRAKSLVHTAVMSRGHMAPIVQTAEDFVKLITTLMPSTQSILITEADIPREEAAWVDVPVIQGIKQFHVIKASPGEPLQFFYNAMHPVATANITDMEGEAERYKVGDWVLVRYDIQLYPGEIMDILEDEYEAKVMTKAAGNRWKWPAADDKLWYTINNVMKKILPPEVVGSRGQFVFHSDDLSV